MISRAAGLAVGIGLALLLAFGAWMTWRSVNQAEAAEREARDSMLVREERARLDSIRNDSLEATLALVRARLALDAPDTIYLRAVTPPPPRPRVPLRRDSLTRDSLETIIAAQEAHIDTLESGRALLVAEVARTRLQLAEERVAADNLIAGKDRELANVYGALQAAQTALQIASRDCRISLLVTSLPCPTRTQVAVGALVIGAAGGYALAR